MKLLLYRTFTTLIWMLVPFMFSLANAVTEYGQVSIEHAYFTQDPLLDGQPDNASSVAAEWHVDGSFNDGTHRLLFVPFARFDANDARRTKVEVRELMWSHFSSNYEFGAGIGREFWGVTEFHHLIDIINQVDFIDDFRGNEKLGQPMVSAAYQAGVHRFEIWWLPVHRERAFADQGERLQFSAELEQDAAQYEKSNDSRRRDHAARWSFFTSGYQWGSADIGVSYYSGTARTPKLVVAELPDAPRLVPFYEHTRRFAFDLQWTIGDWLWKLELLKGDGSEGGYSASTGGLEYNVVGLGGSKIDLGVVAEYMYDERGERAGHFYQRDIGLGLRFSLNDVAATRAQVSLIDDRETSSSFWIVEMSRRIDPKWSASIEAYIFENIEQPDLLFGLRRDDFAKFEITRFF